MILPFVRDLFLELEKDELFRMGLRAPRGPLRLTGLTDTARWLYAALLARAAARPVLLFTANNKQAEAAVDVLATFYELLNPGAGRGSVVLLPAHDTLPYEGLSPHPDISEKRAIALWKLARGQARVVVAPLAAAAMRLQPSEFYAELAQVARRGDEFPLEALVSHLEAVGYLRREPVEMVGQFSVRGGIVDVFSPESPRPVRLEFFGDELESIREFDVLSQRSTGPREEVTLLPLTDFPLRHDLVSLLAEKFHPDDEARYAPGEPFPGWEFLVPLAIPLTSTVFDLTADPMVIVEEPQSAFAELERLAGRLEAEFQQAGQYARVRPEQLYLSGEEMKERLTATRRAYLEELGLTPPEPGATLQEFALASQPAPRFHGNVKQCAEELRHLLAQGYRIVFFAGTTGDVERLSDIFSEYGAYLSSWDAPGAPGRRWLPGRESLHCHARYLHGHSERGGPTRRPAARQPTGDIRHTGPV